MSNYMDLLNELISLKGNAGGNQQNSNPWHFGNFGTALSNQIGNLSNSINKTNQNTNQMNFMGQLGNALGGQEGVATLLSGVSPQVAQLYNAAKQQQSQALEKKEEMDFKKSHLKALNDYRDSQLRLAQSRLNRQEKLLTSRTPDGRQIAFSSKDDKKEYDKANIGLRMVDNFDKQNREKYEKASKTYYSSWAQRRLPDILKPNNIINAENEIKNIRTNATQLWKHANSVTSGQLNSNLELQAAYNAAIADAATPEQAIENYHNFINSLRTYFQGTIDSYDSLGNEITNMDEQEENPYKNNPNFEQID